MLTSIFLIIVAVLVHEIGHLLAFRYFGQQVETISVGFFGWTLFTDHHGTAWKFGPLLLGGYCLPAQPGWSSELPPRVVIWTALAGPLANLALAALLLISAKIGRAFGIEYSDYIVRLIASAIVLNLILAVFNLLPIPPLDGGQVVLASIRAKWGAIATARISKWAIPCGVLAVIAINVALLFS